MAWPGDDAVDKEGWDLPPDWQMREYLLRRLRLSDSHESTDQLLRHCAEQIAECDRRLDEQPDTTTAEEEE
ncbi:hypothetical protein ACLQ18_43225 [Streptomyces sp. DT193]|uniref:hypothetical protein n=1 Tax=Streptomyces sp. DT193 TaxID=3393418 RepID=UPI003CFB2E04